MEILGKLFGSPARVKIIRLFLLNSGSAFDAKSIAARSKIDVASVRRELAMLASIKCIKKQSFVRIVSLKNKKIRRKKVSGWTLNETFPYIEQLRLLLVDSNTINRDEIIKRFKRAGKIKLLTIAGVFTKDSESRLDLMIVGDHLKKAVIEKVIRNLEAEFGKELSYAIFNTQEFSYRLDMYDKLVCDVLDYPHEMLIQQGGLLKKVPAETFSGYPA